MADRHHQMGCHGHLGGVQGPDVQVVHALNARQRQQAVVHRLRVHMLWHAIEQQVQGLPKQAPGAPKDHAGDQQAGDRVEPVPAHPQGQRARHHHTSGHQCIGCHVQKSPLNVQIALSSPHEQQRRHRVHHNAHARHRHDGPTPVVGHGLGRQQAPRGLPHQRAHGHQQQQSVGKRRQNAGLSPAVGVARVGAQPPRQCATPGQYQPCHIAEVVACVGQQGQRIDFPAVERLDRHKGGVQGNANGKRLVEIGGCVAVVVTGTHGVGFFRTSTPLSSVPGATVLNTVPNFFTLSCKSARRRSDSAVSTTIS